MSRSGAEEEDDPIFMTHWEESDSTSVQVNEARTKAWSLREMKIKRSL